MLYSDTIAAIATPPGEGGLGVIRISGPQALAALQAMFAPARPGAWRPYRMRYGHVVDADGAPIDEALAVFMRGPRSYTAEDVAEISCHGGALVLGRALGRALACGARLAEPGEFTMRAFLRGRIDLAQAEATLDIITARTSAGLALAQAQLGGWFSAELARIRALLLDPLAYLTALIDFPEDEVDPQAVLPPLHAARAALTTLLAGAGQGIVYRQGARAAIVGLPNAGKSSLLNALLRADRAIVTPVPGTTRDTLEETASLGGVPVVLIDTAGMAETDDPVERIGVARSRAALAGADLALLVADVSAMPGAELAAVAALTAGRPTILVRNKADLLAPGAPQAAALSDAVAQARGGPPDLAVDTSALAGRGLDELAAAVARLLLGGVAPAGANLVTSPRHRDALARADDLVAQALGGHAAGAPPELLAVDLTAALSAIGEITGDGVSDDLLTTIFSRFCIGK